MNVSAALDRLLCFGEGDWISLWMIVEEVEAELGTDEPEKTLETTVALVNVLLKRGFLAGDSPVRGNATHFGAWSDQELETVARFIRREWGERQGPPTWGDGPWFAAPRLPSGHA